MIDCSQAEYKIEMKNKIPYLIKTKVGITSLANFYHLLSPSYKRVSFHQAHFFSDYYNTVSLMKGLHTIFNHTVLLSINSMMHTKAKQEPKG